MSFTASLALVVLIAIAGLAVMTFRRKPDTKPSAVSVSQALDSPSFAESRGRLAGTSASAPGIDYSRYAGVSPFDIQTRIHPSGLPVGFDWTEWMKVNPGQPDPRVTTQAAARETSGHVLARDGEWLNFDVGTKLFTLPDIKAGQELHLSISGSNEAVLLILRDPYNQPVANRSFPAGAGELRYTCQASGTYSALVDARMAGTINSWRY